MRIRWRLPLLFALGTLLFAGIVALVVALTLRGVFLERLEDEMSRQAHQYAASLQDVTAEDEPLQALTERVGVAADARFTVIDSQGWVLADSEADPKALENHGGRPEVAQALNGLEGRERRQSATLGQEEVYVAVPLPKSSAAWSEGVVRIAQPASRIDSMLAASWRIPLIVWAALLLPTLAVAYLLTRSITRPLERLRHMTAQVASGDLSHRTSVHRNDELGGLAESLNSMAAQLEARDEQLGAEMERSGQVLAAMTEGVLVVDAGGRLLRSNPAAERILGVGLAGAEGSPLVVAARSFPSQALAEKARQAGRAISDVVELPNSRSLTVEVVPLQSPGAQGTGLQSDDAERARDSTGPVLFVVRDETARRATERMRRDFATNVSHELKTPLASLSLLAQTLTSVMREDPEHAEEFVAQLAAQVDRLTGLTTDLLSLSRLEEAEAAPVTDLAPVDLSRVAADTVDEVRPQAEAKRHDLLFQAEQELVVRGDDVSLRTLVRNLLENAIRYTEPGGRIELTLRADQDREGREWAVLSVTDDGVGIPLADQQRVFERFYRVDKARSRETGGTGLGLSIVRHVAERHGGSVGLESTVGVGSTFTVRLPRD
ncbi:MAG: HAMP domain-containing protein [Thermoleophilia bacterium]|nr:HAMP domain-containing protein [Thermoleophilia bacterium]